MTAVSKATQAGDDQEPLPLGISRWSGDADAVDMLVVARCEPPVIDLGCGPGRMVQALTESGLAALGVDMSSVAVNLSRARGGLALRRRIDEQLREDIEEMLLAIGNRDAMHLTRIITRIGSVPADLDQAGLSLDVTDFVSHYASQRLDEFNLSGALREMIERGQTVTAVDWHRGGGTVRALRRSIEPWFDRFDAILTPATTGEAPVGLGYTGNPAWRDHFRGGAAHNSVTIDGEPP